MSGLYPVDQDINIFGEIIKFPSMGTDGKFTNGDFNDPKKPASFIPAETMNLILDNLEAVIKAAGLEPNNTSLTQLLDALNLMILNIVRPIKSFYIQFAEEDGTFDEDKSPSNLFGGIWVLKYNTESVFLRTEGSLSEEGRVNGLQGDAMQHMTGSTWAFLWKQATPNGILNCALGSSRYTLSSNVNNSFCDATLYIDNARQVRTASENRVKNRLIRVYERIA